MEEQLIAEIERRSVLYDRSVQACKKMSARDEAWREVADIMKQSEPEVKKRWRTLRDSFMRFHRLQRTFGPKGKKKMWIYYNEMSFLIPHIEPRDYKYEYCSGEDAAMDQNSRQEPLHAADMVSISSDMCEAEMTTTPPPQPVDGPLVGCPCGGAFNGLHAAAVAGVQQAVHPELQHQQQQQHAPMPHELLAAGPAVGDCSKRKRSSDSEPFDPVADSDEHFALSCVAALRRLPTRKNAEMRMRILHMLYEAEYGEEPVLR